jgi:hypothetical protein
VRVSRRALLVGGSALAVAAGGLGLVALQPSVLREPRAPLTVLDAVAFSTLAAAAERICPAAANLPSAWELQVPEAVDAYLATRDEATAAEVVQLLHLLESGLAGLALDGRPRAFTACSAATQDTVLAAWRDSRLGPRKTGYKALLALVSSAYWAHPETWPHVGYPGPPRFGP